MSCAVTGLLIFISLVSNSVSCAGLQQSSVNGGATCAGCSFVVGLVEQLAEYKNRTVVQAMEMICNFLPAGIFRRACDSLFEEYGAAVIKLLEDRETADVVCLAIDLCKNETGQVCHLYPLPHHVDSHALARRVQQARQTAQSLVSYGHVNLDPCSLPGVAEICKLIDNFADNHLPLYDVDGDHFSTVDTFRGSSWRGKDCDDLNSSIYPGRRSVNDADIDTNCNGIEGIDQSTKRTYEEMWCNGTQQYGTLLLGDSVGAHFHIPPAWLNVSEINTLVFDHLPFMASNELDWPQYSSTTGHLNISWLDVIDGPVQSLYLNLRERNRCNHRDYQNVGVNGARSSAMSDTIVKGFARNPELDHPLFIIYELLGNDVCNSHHDLSHMTTPKEFYDNNKKAFEYVDQHVPPNSHMVVYGVADGRILYNALHDRIHPAGSLHKDVTYSNFYDFLNCLQISPCFGWMNTNETWRNLTTERAMELNSALEQLLNDMTFKNLEVLYIEDLLGPVIAFWKARGGKDWELIEPVDGFHPNQLSNALAAQVFWSQLKKQRPHWIPPANANNAAIVNKFGDQGGY